MNTVISLASELGSVCGALLGLAVVEAVVEFTWKKIHESEFIPMDFDFYLDHYNELRRKIERIGEITRYVEACPADSLSRHSVMNLLAYYVDDYMSYRDFLEAIAED